MGLDKKPRPYSSADVDKAISSIDGGPPSGREAQQYANELEITLEDFRGKRVLDLGAGSGLGFARGLAELKIDAEVHSLSPAFSEPGPAQEVTGFVQDEAAKRAVAGMGQELPYRDNSFDRIVALNVLEHIGSRDQLVNLLGETIRVLKSAAVADIGPLPHERPVDFDIDRFLCTKPLLENVLQDFPGISVEWRPNHSPRAVLIISDTQRKYVTKAYVLTLRKI